MPEPLVALPEIAVGQIVSGDMVLRNVVINTVPSPRTNSGSPLQPASPLNYDGRPYGQIGQPRAIIKPSPPQYADLVIPQNLPADAFSVLIDKRDNSIVKANPQETVQFLQADYYFIGSFDSATADAVIEDMLKNPIPSLYDLVENYTTLKMKLYMGGYFTGLIMASARINALENWGNFVSFQDRIDEANSTPYEAPIILKQTYPKEARVTFTEVDLSGQPPNRDPRSYDGSAEFQKTALAFSNMIGQRLGINLPFAKYNNEILLGGVDSYIVKTPAIARKIVDAVYEFYSDELSDWGTRTIYLPVLNLKSNPKIAQPQAPVLPSRELPANLELASEYNLSPNIDPSYAELTLKYLDLQKQLAELVEKDEHIDITDSQPFTPEQLVDLDAQGLAVLVEAVNPNPSATINDDNVLLYEYIEKNFPDGTSIATWSIAGKKKDFKIVGTGKERSIDGKIYDIVITSTGRKLYALTGILSVPTIQPLPQVVNATVNTTPQYNQIHAELDQVGQQLGVPAGCTPQSPQVLPPQLVSPNCMPIPIRGIPPPIKQTTPSVQVPPSGGGGGGGSGTVADNFTVDPALGIKGGGFIIFPRTSPQGGNVVHYPSGKQFTVVSDGKGGAKIGSYVAGTGLDA